MVRRTKQALQARDSICRAAESLFEKQGVWRERWLRDQQAGRGGGVRGNVGRRDYPEGTFYDGPSLPRIGLACPCDPLASGRSV